MKKLMIKLNGEWREVRALKGGILGFDKSEDGILADFSLVPKKWYDSQGCTFTAIEDIKLVDESEEECLHEGDKNCFRPQYCNKCGTEFIYADPKIYKTKQKIEKLRKTARRFIGNGNFIDEYSNDFLGKKINQIIDLLNSKE